jgi:hypothetical protein
MARRARGAGAVFQRADGRWEAQLRIGPGRRRSLYAQTRRDVNWQSRAFVMLRLGDRGFSSAPCH